MTDRLTKEQAEASDDFAEKVVEMGGTDRYRMLPDDHPLLLALGGTRICTAEHALAARILDLKAENAALRGAMNEPPTTKGKP